MENEGTFEKISIEQAEKNLRENCISWVNDELHTGIDVPVHYWKSGHFKELFSMVMYRSVIVPFLLFALPIIAFLIEEWKAFGILAAITAVYILCGKLLRRRTKMKISLSKESLTFVQGRKKTTIPWKNVKNISYVTEVVGTGFEKRGGYYRSTSGITYEIVVQVENKYYNFYDVYENKMLLDENGRANLPLLPLHIVCALMQTARNYVITNIPYNNS